MAEVKWIKIATDIFDNKKIKIIESMPDGDAIIVIWFKILMLAGNVNDGGSVYFTKDIPYTDQMLATVFNRPLSTIQLALSTFEKFGMIQVVDDVIQLSNWEKYQNVDGLEKIREQTRARVAKHREMKRLEMESQSCAYCGNKATGYDHIIATARGGSDADTNKIPCCKVCNQIKNDKPLVDFLNNNRNRVNDDLVTSNPKLMKYVKLCNVTNRYIVTQCNATDIEEDIDIELDKDKSNKAKSKRFVPPTLEQVQEYSKERGNYVDAQRFIDFYESKGWMVGKNKMKDWKACVRNWERNVKEKIGEKTDVSNRSKNRLKDLEKYYLQKVDDE